jgi:translation initiation factor IF-3
MRPDGFNEPPRRVGTGGLRDALSRGSACRRPSNAPERARSLTISRRFYRAVGPVKKTRVNHEIRLSPIRLIDQNNDQVGVIETREAQRMAEDAGLDLVEIQPDSRPPLCKIMDYGKWKYEQSKKGKGQSGNRAPEMKEVRLGRSAKIGEHDVAIRVEQARRFLMEGHKVQFIQRFRGREMAHQDIGFDRLRQITDDLADIAKLETPPRQAGRQITMIIAPDKNKIELAKRRLEQQRAEQGEAKLSDEELAKKIADLDAAEDAADADDTAPTETEKQGSGDGDDQAKKKPKTKSKGVDPVIAAAAAFDDEISVD